MLAATLVLLAVAVLPAAPVAAVSIETSNDPAAEARRLLEETGGIEGGIVDARVNQTPEDGLKQDLELVAEARGWTFEQSKAQYLAAEEVGAVAEEVARNRPDIFVGSALSKAPGGVPLLYIKGPADGYIRLYAANWGRRPLSRAVG
jgi:hypothetical protein